MKKFPLMLIISTLLITPLSFPQIPEDDGTVEESRRPEVAVVLAGDTLFFLHERFGPYTAQERAAAISARLKNLAKSRDQSRDSLTIIHNIHSSDILVGDLVLMSLTDADALSAGTSRRELAEIIRKSVQKALKTEIKKYNLKNILLSVGYTIVTLIFIILILRLFTTIFPRVYKKLKDWQGTRIRTLRLQKVEILSEERITYLLIMIFKGLRVFLTLILFYLSIPLLLSFFPSTRRWAAVIINYIMNPLQVVWNSVLDFLPNLFFITVILFVTHYVIRFVKFLFGEIRKGTITLPGFYRDWADPTFKIVRFLMLVFVAIVIFPYLPGSSSPAFKGISVFLGLLFSLGSASAISNIIAGTVLTYMRAFQLGDRVRIAETEGDVVDKTLLVTRVRTIKNVDITIPNAMVLGSHIINFSSSSQERGLVLHSTVTIGYDVPWRQVHELLLDAAAKTGYLLEEPAPFVLQTALNDFYVSYELNAFTDDPGKMAQIYSDLHQNIQDVFNSAGVEIMSPHYAAVRDGNQATVPTEYLPKDYKAPGFRILPRGWGKKE
ncbi:mechanosensitive ion channel [candidate division KSB1 bacterium]|nr:mechanosensitive ion channel [candidate division KSB1 bacterium]